MKPEDMLSAAMRFGFQKLYFCDPSTTAGVPSGIQSLVLLLKPYLPWDAEIDAFYIADNVAYHDAKSMAAFFSASREPAVLLPQVNYKMICSALPPFRQGKNTLHYHHPFGSYFCLQLIGLYSAIPFSFKAVSPSDVCGNCTLCADACPTGAIEQTGFARERCLRNHMLSGRPIPLEMRNAMGGRLLGCDVCQRVCPLNRGIIPAQCSMAFPLSRLLPPDDHELNRYTELIGTNYANANRLCAQAALAAGNRGDKSLLGPLKALKTHASEVIRTHAAWAVERITSE
jgi:epoxyqueuosine reductase